MHAGPTAAPLTFYQLQLLDSFAATLLESLDSALCAERILSFTVEHVACEAQLWLSDERGGPWLVRSRARSAGFTEEEAVELPLRAHGRRIGTLKLRGVYEPRASEFFERFVRNCSYALYNARSYEHEQHVSLTFQNGAMAVALPQLPGIEFSAVYEAGRAEALVGGDWYDAFPLQDGRFVISVGDVCGSGLAAAVTMVNVRQSLRGVAYVHADPIFMLKAAEETLRSQYPGRYVTAFVGVVDPVLQTCSYANAGHPPPFLRDADGAVRPLCGHSLPLGIHDLNADFEPNHITLSPGCLLVLYTDGITEANRDPVDGERRLMEAISEISPPNPRTAEELHRAVLPVHASDDVAILTMYFSHGADVRRWRFDPRWADVAQRARQEVLDELTAAGLDESQQFFVQVIISELLANMMRHAEGTAEIAFECRGGDLILHAIDKGSGFYFSPRLPNDLFSERGRGLFVIAELSKEFTVDRRPGGGSHARVVLKNEGAQL